MNDPGSFDRVSRAVEIAREFDRRDRQKIFEHLFPDETHTWRGQTFHSRDLYKKHLEFFEAGADYRERTFLAANRVGKTMSGGGFEIACHLTGRYPEWWPGRRFDHPIEAWAAGVTNETTRDIIQTTLFGEVTGSGINKSLTGFGVIPGDAIGGMSWRQGVNDLLDTIKVKHVSGRWSTLGLKSYQQGRSSFEGTAKHVIWGDEEIPFDIYGECLIRTATTNGLLMVTFTPLQGLTETVMQFLPGGMADIQRRMAA